MIVRYHRTAGLVASACAAAPGRSSTSAGACWRWSRI